MPIRDVAWQPSARRVGAGLLLCVLVYIGRAAGVWGLREWAELEYPWIVSWCVGVVAACCVRGRGLPAAGLRVLLLLVVGAAHQLAAIGAMMLLAFLWPGLVRNFGLLQVSSIAIALAPFLAGTLRRRRGAPAGM